jgi:hypothetical protein
MARRISVEDECMFTFRALSETFQQLKQFLVPYAKAFVRREQREHAETYVRGRLRNLPRRTIEPIANAT